MKFSKGTSKELDFPVIDIPGSSNGLVNPCVGQNRFGVPAPSMPEDGDVFYAELFDVIRVRHDVERGVWPGWFFEQHGLSTDIPEALSTYGGITDAQSAASAVHMDAPIDLGLVIMAWCAQNKVPFANTVPGDGHADFLGNPVDLIATLSGNVAQALRDAFETKYFFGRPRPEEVTGFGPALTHYPEGCPKHPAYPSGHQTAAGATYATLIEFYDFDDAQRLELEMITKHFGHYRVLAGVHYFSDGIGWDLGIASVQGLDTVSSCSVSR